MVKIKLKSKRIAKKGFPAKVLGFVAFIRPNFFQGKPYQKYADTRIEQFWQRPLSHEFKYLFNSDYKMDCEIQAMNSYLKVADPLWYPAHVDYLSAVLAKKCKINKYEAFRIISNL
jgi:hypothetical protein